jgi:hypothetical protein
MPRLSEAPDNQIFAAAKADVICDSCGEALRSVFRKERSGSDATRRLHQSALKIVAMVLTGGFSFKPVDFKSGSDRRRPQLPAISGETFFIALPRK